MSQYSSYNTNTNSKRLLSTASLSSLHSSYSESSWDSCTVGTPTSEHEMSFETCIADPGAFTNPFAIMPNQQQEYMAIAMTPQHSQHMPYTPYSSFSSSSDMMGHDCAHMYNSHVDQTFVTQHGLPSPPLDMNYSMNLQSYVAPTEISFHNHIESSSPVRSHSTLNLQSHYSSPISHHSNISFEDIDNAYVNVPYQRSTMTPASSIASSPLRSPVQRMIKTERPTYESSTALQSIQSIQLESARKKMKKDRRAKRSKCGGTLPDNVTRVERAIYHCGFDGCKATFGKSEHWKRHEETVHDGERFLCKYCEQGNKCKTFQKKRLDNYKTHLELHLQHTPRTHYNLDAILDIARLILNRKVKKGAKKAPAHEPVDFVNEVINGIKQDLDDATVASCRQRLENSRHLLTRPQEADSDSSS